MNYLEVGKFLLETFGPAGLMITALIYVVRVELKGVRKDLSNHQEFDNHYLEGISIAISGINTSIKEITDSARSERGNLQEHRDDLAKLFREHGERLSRIEGKLEL